MKRTLALAVLFLAVAVLLWQPAQHAAAPDNAPRYAPDGKLLKPANYRDWVFLTSGLGMNYSTGPSSHAMFTNVFVNPEAYREFARTGHWPDQTTWVVELYWPVTHGSINKGGHYQDAPMGLDVEVKDSSRPNGWQYYFVGLDDTAVAETGGAARCLSCHSKSGAVENTFVQFYPTLLDVAVKKGTLNPGYVAPLNATRLYDAILDGGWEKAAAALDADAKLNPNSEFLTGEKLADVDSRLLNNGKRTEAVALFERIVRDSPGSTEAYATLADAYAQAGRKEKAIAALKQALAVPSKDPDVPAGDRKAWEEEGQKRLAELSK